MASAFIRLEQHNAYPTTTTLVFWAAMISAGFYGRIDWMTVIEGHTSYVTVLLHAGKLPLLASRYRRINDSDISLSDGEMAHINFNKVLVR
jgi:hypothetical protein